MDLESVIGCSLAHCVCVFVVFRQAYEGLHSLTDARAVLCLKYMIMCKIMTDDVRCLRCAVAKNAHNIAHVCTSPPHVNECRLMMRLQSLMASMGCDTPAPR